MPRTVSDQMGTITARQWQAPPPVSPNAACLWVRNERDLAITVRGLRLRVRSGAVAAATIIPPIFPIATKVSAPRSRTRGKPLSASAHDGTATTPPGSPALVTHGLPRACPAAGAGIDSTVPSRRSVAAVRADFLTTAHVGDRRRGCWLATRSLSELWMGKGEFWAAL